ncbi:hypothetical protein GRI89_08430 [Altererythrobacter salegens]|uniref:SMP-30/Gluconolactonase/LRE-like region domain-containing protein n=1 Tax=Croceibacterium salegens TaxID=1737568 RepID=A0A6I4SXI3_9SPHN|nr:hypothetical protein [Croceibacterium salegens]MXO59566.1 hypothetical protein [Croceibacterium salegens]
MVSLAAALASLAVGKASAEDWAGADAETGQIADIAGLVRLAARFPDSGSVALRLLNAQLAAGEMTAALQKIVVLYSRGYRLSAASEERLLDMADADQAAWLGSLFGRERQSIEASTVFATIPANALLVESLAQDPQSGALYATSVVSHDLFVSVGGGEWRALGLRDAAALTGIVRDPRNGMIWVSSGDPGLGSEPLPGFRGLIGYNPAKGAIVRRIAAPEGSNPSDLAIAPDGTLYVSDGLAGVIYRAAPGAESLEVAVPVGTFRSPQGLAVVRGGKRLYVCDYRYGLAWVDVPSGKVNRLSGPGLQYLDGIDGLWLHGDALIAVQNGNRPMRIVRLVLSSDGKSIESARVLEQANPAWTEPLGGTLVGDQLLYIGNGQWNRFGEGGAPDPDNPPGPTQIRALPLGK